MTSIRKLASVLLSASLCLSYSVSKAQAPVLDPSQVYTTPDLVLPTNQGGPSPWVNGVYQDNLTCWAWGNPGYCGPNPIVRPGNSINFSYGWTDIFQQQAVAGLLPNSGNGLRINGYNFGFMAKNGNGWDDGRTDLLYAYVQFNDPTGASLLNRTHNLSYQFNWSQFNFSENFTTPYATKDLGSVRYGFVGRDNNFWAGPYGPEIYNINFSLKYSVDPCSVNVLSSPSCPGYLTELAKLNPPTTSSPVTTTSVVSEPVVVNPVVISPAPTSSPVVETAVVSVQPTVSSSPVAVATTTLSTPSVSTTPTPSVNNPQPRVGEVTQSGPPRNTVSTSQILSIIATENSRLSSVERSVVENTTQQANLASTNAVQQAESVAASLTSQSITTSLQVGQSSAQSVSGTSNQNNVTVGSNQGLLAPTQNVIDPSSNQTSFSLSSLGLSSSNETQSTNNTSFFNFNNAQLSSVNFNNFSEVKQEERGFSITNSITEEKPNALPVIEQRQETQKSSVNQRTKDNDLAGGVTLASIARQPLGFESYMGILPDSRFYAPKEIYRGQKTIDNPAGRRLMGGSDRLHQEMVNQQYK